MKWQRVIFLFCWLAIICIGSVENRRALSGRGFDERARPLGAQLKQGKDVLLYGTYLGGSLWDEAYAVASDADGNIYLVGHTQSLDFPTTGSGTSRHACAIAFKKKILNCSNDFSRSNPPKWSKTYDQVRYYKAKRFSECL